MPVCQRKPKYLRRDDDGGGDDVIHFLGEGGCSVRWLIWVRWLFWLSDLLESACMSKKAHVPFKYDNDDEVMHFSDDQIL